MIPQDSKLWNDYLVSLRNKVFKILPLVQENNEGVFKYVDSLIFELYGLRYVVEEVDNGSFYITLLCVLESILDEILVQEKDFAFIRSRILDLTSAIEKLQKSEV